jgi:ubiquinone/menaquinone biosynthesis C-methylase UbiE
MFKPRCRACYLRFFCGGGCFCQSYYSSKTKGKGDITAEDPYCSVFKGIIHDVLWELATPADRVKENESYERPVVFASMESRLPSCAVPSTKVTDFSSEVGLFHCSCVLGVDLEGEKKIMNKGNHRLTRDACFNELAYEYESWLQSPIGKKYNKEAKEAVYARLDLKEGEQILEVGCGTGNYTLDLAEQNRVVGTDVSEWMLRLCIEKSKTKKLDLDLHHVTSVELPFQDEFFDKVLCVNVLEFALNPEELVKEMVRVLKKGGQLILCVLNKNSIWGLSQGIKKSFARGAYYEAKFYTPGEVKRLLKPSNTDIKLSTSLFFPPLNNHQILRLSGLLGKIGGRFFNRNGALILVKAVKL